MSVNARLIEEAHTTHESLDLTLRLADALAVAEAEIQRLKQAVPEHLEQVGWVEPNALTFRRNYPTIGWEPVYRLRPEDKKDRAE